MNREKECCAGDQLLVVDVAAVLARGLRNQWPPGLGWCNSHDAEERFQRDFGAPRHSADHPPAIEWNVDDAKFWKVVGQGAARRDWGAPAADGYRVPDTN